LGAGGWAAAAPPAGWPKAASRAETKNTKAVMTAKTFRADFMIFTPEWVGLYQKLPHTVSSFQYQMLRTCAHNSTAIETHPEVSEF
jgi:hypothetical protein